MCQGLKFRVSITQLWREIQIIWNLATKYTKPEPVKARALWRGEAIFLWPTTQTV